MTQDEIAKKAEELIEGLCDIPVKELVQCARENMKATYPVRVDKDTQRECPDYTVRQRALEWISAQRGASAVALRKPVEPAKDKSEGSPAAGELLARPRKA